MTHAETIPAQSHWRYVDTAKSSGEYVTRNVGRRRAAEKIAGAKRDAVYAYLRSVRSLGRTRVSTIDVARALDLNEGEVRKIMAELRDRGVRGI